MEALQELNIRGSSIVTEAQQSQEFYESSIVVEALQKSNSRGSFVGT